MRSQAQCPARRWSVYSAMLRFLMYCMALRSTAQEASLSNSSNHSHCQLSPLATVCSSWLEPPILLSPLEMPHFLAHHPHTHVHTHTLWHQVYEALYYLIHYQLQDMPLFTVCVWARGARCDHVWDMPLPLPIHYVWLSEFNLLQINEKLTRG